MWGRFHVSQKNVQVGDDSEMVCEACKDYWNWSLFWCDLYRFCCRPFSLPFMLAMFPGGNGFSNTTQLFLNHMKMTFFWLPVIPLSLVLNKFKLYSACMGHVTDFIKFSAVTSIYITKKHEVEWLQCPAN